jgi:hypothetical protein
VIPEQAETVYVIGKKQMRVLIFLVRKKLLPLVNVVDPLIFLSDTDLDLDLQIRNP